MKNSHHPIMTVASDSDCEKKSLSEEGKGRLDGPTLVNSEKKYSFCSSTYTSTFFL